jgi:hypothetical protein
LNARQDTNLIAVGVDDAQLRRIDLFVAPYALNSWSSDASFLMKR